LRSRGKAGSALDDAGDAQHGFLVERTADDLQTQWQPILAETGRHRDTRQSGKAGGTVKTSLRYIAMGSSAFSPIAKAVEGAVGVRMQSTSL
jgi:hypothetical protein